MALDDPKSPESPALVSARASFDLHALPEFLNNGMMLALDSHHVFVQWGAQKTAADSGSSSAFYMPDFYLETEEPWRCAPSWDVLERDRFASLVLTAQEPNVNANVASKNQRFQWLEPKLQEFAKQWNELREGMSKRGLNKAVPVVFARAQSRLDPSRRLMILKSLVKLPRHLYLYGFWTRDEGLLGATPELLFSSSETGCLETIALAGTRSKAEGGADAASHLLHDPKERYEHQLVVEDIQSRLALIGDVAVGNVEVMELPTLYHLKTRLQSRPTRAMKFPELVELLHPTPALGLSPRALGFAELKRWDTALERGRFGAPFGVTWRDEAGVSHEHCVVAIRNIQWSGDDVQLGSGCGVVGESQIDREWAELQLKRDSVKRMLDL